MGRTLDPDRFAATLENGGLDTLGPLVIVTGDEQLLCIEATDALRHQAMQSGYTERTSLVLDARADWSEVLSASRNVSLFGDRRLLELSLPSGKPGRTGADTLQALAQQAADKQLDDTLVVLGLPRLDKTTRNSKWAQALFQAATVLEIPSITRAALPDWISRRLARQKQSLDRPTLEWMADKVEGNLLAAHQEILKLGLLYPEGRIDPDDVQRAVLNVARYDVFGLRDAMLAGQAARALAVLRGLQAEGEALPLVFWAVGDEVRLLARLSALAAGGQDVSAEMRRQRVFGPREQGLRQTLSRVPATAWPAAVQHAHDIDRLIKGLKVPGRLDDPWEELARLLMRIALGQPRKMG